MKIMSIGMRDLVVNAVVVTDHWYYGSSVKEYVIIVDTFEDEEDSFQTIAYQLAEKELQKTTVDEVSVTLRITIEDTVITKEYKNLDLSII